MTRETIMNDTKDCDRDIRTNGDYIRSLDNDRLNRFLWTWGINHLTSFLEHGGERLMNAKDSREWLDKDYTDSFVCEETRVSKEFVYGQDFELREGKD